MGDLSDLTSRPLTMDDKPSVLAVINASEEHSPVPIQTTAEDLDDEFNEPGCDFESDSLSLWDGDRLVGWIRTAMRDNPTRAHVVWMTGRVDPSWERQGVGSTLVRWAVDRGRQRLTERPDDLPKSLRATVYDVEPGSVALYASCGFEPERYFIELTKNLTAAHDDVIVPDDIEIVPWTRQVDDDVRRAHNEAFKDHWGSEPLTLERWERWISRNRAFLPEHSYVAMAGGEVAGYVMNFAYPEEWDHQGFKDGWINGLGTARQWRKRGIASALVQTSNNAFRELGYAASSLGVDADSPTGALGLYSRLGFEPVRREISMAIAVTDGD